MYTRCSLRYDVWVRNKRPRVPAQSVGASSVNIGTQASQGANVTWTVPTVAPGATVTVGVGGMTIGANPGWYHQPGWNVPQIPTTIMPNTAGAACGGTLTGGTANQWPTWVNGTGINNAGAAGWQQGHDDLIDAWRYTPPSPPAWVDGPELEIGDLIELTLDQHVVALLNMLNAKKQPQSRDGTLCHALVVPASFGSHAMCPCRDHVNAHYHLSYVDGAFEHDRGFIVIGDAVHGSVRVLSRGA